MRRKQNLASTLGIPQKIGGNHAFFRDSFKSFNLGKTAIQCFIFWRFFEILLLNYFLIIYPQFFSFWIPIALAKSCFSHIVDVCAIGLLFLQVKSSGWPEFLKCT